ncbi:sulfotransferase family 2 domain-containing protein [Burkholderia cenocepacia]|nr:sulfotransferase family 2 domain-containing protein [Burkholderia cenocepacia]
MKRQSHIFSGRVIFDHLPKTAGQAVNAWLSKTLGAGNVTPNLIGRHRDLIRRYGGEYAVISAHIEFRGTGLDPRYHYVTCLREPIDRALSWLFFVVKNHEVEQLPGLWEQVEHFIASEGDDLGGSVFDNAGAPADWDLCLGNITNPYVEHFARVSGAMPRTDDERIRAALSSVEQYDVCGLYEDIPDFLSEVGALIGVSAPAQFEKVNVTRARPAAERISEKFRRRLEALNELDIEFYRVLRERWQAERRERASVSVIEPAGWQPYQPVDDRVFDSSEVTLLSATIEGGDAYLQGQVVRFNLAFSMNVDVSDLEIGIDICDEDGGVAFSTNNVLLSRHLNNVTSGTYCTRYYLVANLPEGQYTAGFSFVERRSRRIVELARYEALISFKVNVPRLTPSEGYVCVPTDFECHRTSDSVSGLVVDAAGHLVSDAVLGELSIGENFELELALRNTSSQTWISTQFNQISLSYHWLDDEGKSVVFDGGRTPLPEQLTPAGTTLAVRMRIAAPNMKGRYRLVLVPVQEGNCWFDQRGFEPLMLDFDVVMPNAARVYRGADVRLSSHVGRRESGAIASTGQEGFLMFGPYAALSPGRYSARLEGWFESSETGAIWLDICSDRGMRVLARSDVTSAAEPGVIADCKFTLDHAVTDLEVRVWVAAQAQMRLDVLRINPL